MPQASDARTRTPSAPHAAGRQGRQAHAWRLIPRLVLMTCLAALAASQAFLPSAQAGAGPCRVPSTAYLTIQAAVNAATCAMIDVAAGTYSELITIARDVTIRGAGQESTAIDGGGLGPVVTIARGTVTLRAVTIQNGGNFVDFSITGGIDNSGTLTLENCTVLDNHSRGGIWNQGTLTIKSSTIVDNRGPIQGGIFNSGRLTVQNSTISGNVAPEGGGISNRGTLTVQDSTVSDNRGSFGGGISNSGTLTVRDSTVSDNHPSAFGGGIYNSNSGTLTVRDSTVSDNRVDFDGGGIFNADGGIVTLTDVTFENNIPNDCTGCPGLL